MGKGNRKMIETLHQVFGNLTMWKIDFSLVSIFGDVPN